MTRESPVAVAMRNLLSELGDLLFLDVTRVQRYLQPFLLLANDRLSDEQRHQAELAARKARIPRVSGGVAVYRMYGTVHPRGGWGCSLDELDTFLNIALATKEIKGVIFDVDSPGGSVYGVDAMARKIYDARGAKPMVAITNFLNASAAYYLSSAVDQLYAEPGSDTGSIGVWSAHINAQKFFEEWGVDIRLFHAGKYKVEGHPFGPLDEEGEGEFQRRVDDYYGEFIDAVARHRGVRSTDVRNGFGEGRVVGAKRAMELGMIDRVLTMDQLRASMGVARSGSSAAADADLQAYFAEALGLDAEPEEPGDDGPEPPAADSRTPPAAGTDTDEDGEQTPDLNESGENVEIRRKRLQLRQQMCRLT